MHGHTYNIEIMVRGALDEHAGWVVDFEEIDEAVAPVIAVLDHRCLNDVRGLENPTSENVARWLWERIAGRLDGLSAVTVAENPDSVCVYRED
jgi:6-pyruvoyltetrahydropterin/6-carboxytetrahydropterin synthase